MIAAALHQVIAAVCPIDGVSIGRRNDKQTWRIDFAAHATKEERAAATAALAAFDPASVEIPTPRDLAAEVDAIKGKVAALETKGRGGA